MVERLFVGGEFSTVNLGILQPLLTLMTAVRKWVCRKFRPDDADQLVHDTMVRLCEKIENFRYESTLLTFAFGIANNVWCEHLAAKRRECASEPEPWLDTVKAPDDPEQEAYRKLIVEDCLEHLADDERQFVRLHFWDQLSIREIAEMMTMSAQDAEAFQKRLLRKIRKHWIDNDA